MFVGEHEMPTVASAGGTRFQSRKGTFLFPGGHAVPRTEMLKEPLQWLDRTLGPVQQWTLLQSSQLAS